MLLGPDAVDEQSLVSAVEAESGQRRALMPQTPLLPVLLTKQEELGAWCLRRVAGDFAPVPEQVVTVRKAGHGVRPVAELYLRDQLVYRALAARLGGALPIPPRSAIQFEKFVHSPLSEPDADYILSADIASFYQYIDYDMLGRELIARTGDALRVDSLVELLSNVTGRRFGLPQQNSASDVLANAYIDVLERKLLRRGLKVWRYNDDFRVATKSWSDALAAVDLLDREARAIGLSLNDAKTVIRKRATYEAQIARRDEVRQEIANEAEFDLTEVYVTPYDEVVVEPDPGEVNFEAARKILDRWAAAEDDDPAVVATLVQLLPYAFAQLAAAPATTGILHSCMAMLRIEQTMTPSVAQYIAGLQPDDEGLALAEFTELLDQNPYLTPWQTAWLAPAFSRMEQLAVGTDGARLSRFPLNFGGGRHDRQAATMVSS